MATEKHILVESNDGLYCLNIENGSTLWHFGPTHSGTNISNGLTPAVDQTNGFIYYQSYNRLWKLNAINGAVLDFVIITTQTLVASGNTILVNDVHGYFIACYYYANVAYGGAIKVFDANLDLVWEVTGLNASYKNKLCYHDGLLFTGTGDPFFNAEQIGWYTGELEQCRVIAYDITDGSVEWTFDPYPLATWNKDNVRGIMEVIYCNGYIIAETNTSGSKNYEVFVLDVTDGSVVKSYEHTAPISSCGTPALSKGKLFTGDLYSNKIVVIVLGTGDEDDFAPFGTHQTNTMEAPDTALATIADTIISGGSVAGGNQGVVIKDSIVYANHETAGCVAFDVDTLSIIRTYSSGTLWDSSPMVVQNIAGQDVLLVKENANARVKAMFISDGSLIWYSDAGMEGNLFFGFNYYELTHFQFANGISGESTIAGLNANFAALNFLIADAATIITITSAVQWDDINANIASLNTEGVAVSVDTITVGMTGTQLNTIINGFVSDYVAANS
jgi:hypothetical protein